MKQLLIAFINKFVNFRQAEYESIAYMFGCGGRQSCSENHEIYNTSASHSLFQNGPFAVVPLDSHCDVQNIVSRSLLIKYGAELIACGSTKDELHTNLASNMFELEKYGSVDESWCIRVETYNKTTSTEYKTQRIEELSVLPFDGPVKLSNADNVFYLIEYYGEDGNNIPEEPCMLYFCRFITAGQRRLPDKFNLKQRVYIGNTSMDPTLSLIMANVVGCRPGTIVLDPFVGTGSLILAAAHFGSFVIGTDIDYNVIHAKGKSSRQGVKYRREEESIRANFVQKNLENRLIDVYISDSSQTDLYARGEFLDGIITDPPYGLREKTVKEYESIAYMFGCGGRQSCSENHEIYNTSASHSLFQNGPFAVVPLDSHCDVQNIVSRSLLIKYGAELIACGSTKDELHTNLASNMFELEKYGSVDESWCIRVETYNKTTSTEYKTQRIEELSVLPFDGPVKLSNADNVFYLIEYYGEDGNNIPEEPCMLYFCRFITAGQRRLPDKFNLKQRVYIGNTSMDPTLSLIMANVVGCRPGTIVLDPFVGTGSLILAAAHFGSFVIGTDIDYNVIHAKGKSSRQGVKYRREEESIRANFVQKNLENRLIDVYISDSSQTDLYARGEFLDGIITDPPYGLREKTVKVGVRPTQTLWADTPNPKTGTVPHFPAKTHYDVVDVYLDLLNFASAFLVTGGRLVYWLPFTVDEYSDECVPAHPCLSLIANCEQLLVRKRGRRMIVMQKIKSPQTGDCAYVSRNMFSENGLSFRETVHPNADKAKHLL